MYHSSRKSPAFFLALLFCVIALFSCGTKRQLPLQVHTDYPKREFRAAWIQTVYQGEYARLSPAEVRRLLIGRLDKLKEAGCNAIIFQIRPESDAWYESAIEPWSRFLTGRQGQAPTPLWDPLAFMVSECHKRGMELHAWINPYRASTSGTAGLAPNHPYHRYPQWFVTYNNQLYYDPGVPDCRAYICRIVRDITMRYDIDAIHMDDYFYPYPVAGAAFPDGDSFRRYGQGYTSQTKGDWRRENVNKLVHEIKLTILQSKPWVRFGISPFGIYRNKRSSPSGSETAGLQNYDDLYADVLLWQKKGWIDYVIPQIYWEIGHKAADYATLAEWWGRNSVGATHLYFGQDIKRTMTARQLAPKMRMQRAVAAGHALWPAGEVVNNTQGVADSLRSRYHRYPALIPAYTAMHRQAPPKVKGLHAAWLPSGFHLIWLAEKDESDPVKASYFVVYAFRHGVKKTTQHAENIWVITPENSIRLPDSHASADYTYWVTAVDRFHNESKPAKLKVKARYKRP